MPEVDATVPPESGTDGAAPVETDASVIVADASTADVSAGDSSALPDGGTAGAAGNLGSLPNAPEFEGGSCACRAAGGRTGNSLVGLLPLLGLALAAARRRNSSERRRPSV
jgi:MYXO-CTERM domain-containing protein